MHANARNLAWFWSLEFGVSLEFGAWNLEFLLIPIRSRTDIFPVFGRMAGKLKTATLKAGSRMNIPVWLKSRDLAGPDPA